MKKTLKFALILSIIIALLGGHTAVLAVEVNDMLDNASSATPEVQSGAPNETMPITTNEEATPTAEPSPTEEPTTEPTSETSPAETTPPPEEKAKLPERPDVNEQPGTLNVEIDLRLPQKEVSANDFVVTLNDGTLYGGFDGTPKMETGSGEDLVTAQKLFYTFENVPARKDYKLTIKGAEGTGYKAFEQSNIEVKPNTTTELSYSNGYKVLEIFDINKNGKIDEEEAVNGLPGVVPIGDVNRDGNINGDDSQLIIRKIEEEQIEEDAGYNYDLYKDGEVDIVDLTYAFLNKNRAYSGSIPRQISNVDTSSENISAGVTEGNGKLVVDAKDPKLATSIVEVLEDNDKHVTLQPPVADKPISVDNAVEVGIDISNNTTEAEHLTIAPSDNSLNNIKGGIFTVDGYDYENDRAVEIVCALGNAKDIPTTTPTTEPTTEATTAPETEATSTPLAGIKVLGVYAENDNIQSDVKANNGIATIAEPVFEPINTGSAEIKQDGTIVVNFGSKIAVKRVIIKVTETSGTNLADISKVEFLNGMENKIPEPQLNIPKLRQEDITASVTEENFTVRWDNVPNVTGYRVRIRANLGGATDIVETHEVQGHELKVEQFNNDFIKNHLDKSNKDEITKYYIGVCAINGNWSSPYSDDEQGKDQGFWVQPRPTTAPKAPTGLTVKGGYQELNIAWDADRRALAYMVQYRKYGEGDDKWIDATSTKEIEEVDPVTGKTKKVIEGTDKTSIKVEGLESTETTYEVRVKSRNTVGESPWCDIATGNTTTVQEVELPKFKLINKSTGKGSLSENIEDIRYEGGEKPTMIDSDLDLDEKGELIKGSAKGVADNSYQSYYQISDWDCGGFYEGATRGNIQVKFKEPYTMNYITFAKVEWTGDIGYGTVYYKNETGKWQTVRASQVTTKMDQYGHKYTAIKLPKPITAKEIAVGVGHSNMGNRKITIAEMAFYEYDELETKIDDLFADAMHLSLSEDIKKIAEDQGKEAAKAEVEKLRTKLYDPTRDESGEINPEAENLNKEINTAIELIEKGSFGKITYIDSSTSSYYETDGTYGSKVEFANSLNGYQPLGVAARSGEQVTVYVGNPYKNVGESTRLQLIATQWRAEAGKWEQVVVRNLSVGANTVTIPRLIDTSRERGGSLYINYTGLKDDDPTRYIDRAYAVRVDGGIQIPVLDISSREHMDEAFKVSEEVLKPEDREAKILEYVKEIHTATDEMAQKHETECKTSVDKLAPADKYTVQEFGNGEDCLQGLTEIVLDDIMYSVSSKQIYEALEGNTDEEKAKSLSKSLTAMEDMIELFYSQKGMVKETSIIRGPNPSKDLYPRTRLNIRCMRMTGSAFMYAGGKHIGIQWNETRDLAKGSPFTVADDGAQTVKGNYFGWGIAHEIGHQINQQAYVHGEVTNNYYSILAQTDDTRNTVRFNYKDVYDKVTSGKKGKAQNVFTQLGLYWQLHLAYDLGGYNYKQYKTQAEQLANSIVARMDSYARDTSKAPATAIPLKVDSDSDNNLMRLACAATGKNTLEFFEKWGMTPNEDTLAYANQFEQKEERAIWYVNDEARNYRLEHPNADKVDAKVTAKITNAENNRIKKADENQVKFEIGLESGDKSGILGYEVVRSYMSNKDTISKAVAFIEPTETESGVQEFTDIVTTINNRVFTYTVNVYDKYLNKVDSITLDPVKVSHNGAIDKSDWQISTNMNSTTDKDLNYEENKNDSRADVSDSVQTVSKITELLTDKDTDGNVTTYTGTTNAKDEDGNYTVSTGKDAEITISLREVKKLVSLKYTGPEKINNYEVQVSSDGENWTTVAKREEQKEEQPIAMKILEKAKELATGEEEEEKFGGSEEINFTRVVDGNSEVYNYDYDCSYVKFIIHDTEVTLSSLDLLGQSGDNVEFTAGEGSFGQNAEDYVYAKDEEGEHKIAHDSIIFTGTYKGNPAYNVVKLWIKDNDESDWRIVNGYQLILGADPKDGNLGETDEGGWIYVIDKNELELDGTEGGPNPDYTNIPNMLGTAKVRVELYRVDNAKTNEGERLVSDSLVMTLPDKMEQIDLQSDSNINK